MLAHTRWQIELLFTLWKSHGQIDTSRRSTPWWVLCEVYAPLLALVVQHWRFLVRCWRYPDRSMLKAAQIARTHAFHRASTFGEAPDLSRAIATRQRCLAAGYRMNRRKKAPNTFRLLLELTDGGLA